MRLTILLLAAMLVPVAAAETDWGPEVTYSGVIIEGLGGEKFDVKIGKWHNKPIGPHPNSMYQFTFDASIFSDIILWLSANRNNLNILIHPQSGDNLKDHTDLAIWLGKSLELKLDSFTKKV